VFILALGMIAYLLAAIGTILFAAQQLREKVWSAGPSDELVICLIRCHTLSRRIESESDRGRDG
jgi:hypothetical protein